MKDTTLLFIHSLSAGVNVASALQNAINGKAWFVLLCCAFSIYCLLLALAAKRRLEGRP